MCIRDRSTDRKSFPCADSSCAAPAKLAEPSTANGKCTEHRAAEEEGRKESEPRVTAKMAWLTSTGTDVWPLGGTLGRARASLKYL